MLGEGGGYKSCGYFSMNFSLLADQGMITPCTQINIVITTFLSFKTNRNSWEIYFILIITPVSKNLKFNLKAPPQKKKRTEQKQKDKKVNKMLFS